MALDLSELDESVYEPSAAVADGSPLELRLADIEEDPDQPRTEFDPVYMQSLTDSIREKKVHTPISVRPHPTKKGKWIINNGARRYRASIAAKKLTIPAFVDADFDDYDQVIVNDQHATLTTMERVLFIAKKVAQGDKKGDIARRLSIDSASITHHLALKDLPASIDAVMRSGRCTSPKTLYDLRSLHDDFGSEVDVWCAQAESVTRAGVAALAEVLRRKPVVSASTSAEAPAAAKDSATGGSTPARAPAAPQRAPASDAAQPSRAAQVSLLLKQLSDYEEALAAYPDALTQLRASLDALQALQVTLATLESA